MAANEKQWSSATPGLLIILVDQSGSMLSNYIGNESKAEFASKVVNRAINEIIQYHFIGDKPKDKCLISVIGYSQTVKEICSGYLTALYESPIRIEKIKRKVADGAGGLIEIECNIPIWIEPIAQGEMSNMKSAFMMAKELVERWMQDKPENPAPVIVNISNGIPCYEGKEVSECMKETNQVAKEIMSLSNRDGNVLVFNAQLNIQDEASVYYPCAKDEVCHAGETAEFLFDITSEIPESFAYTAERKELPIKEHSRGYVLNVDDIDLLGLITLSDLKYPLVPDRLW